MAPWISPLAATSPRLLGAVHSGLHLCHKDITTRPFPLRIFSFPDLKLLWHSMCGLQVLPGTLMPLISQAKGHCSCLVPVPEAPPLCPFRHPAFPCPNKWCNQRQLFKLGERSPPSLHPPSGQEGAELGGGLAAGLQRSPGVSTISISPA